MRKILLALTVTSALLASMLVGGAAQAETADVQGPLVSTAWLSTHLDTRDLVVVDVRPAADYQTGHIAGSISMPFVVPESAWITSRDDLLLEIPNQTTLFTALGNAGIKRNSRIVLVTNMGQPPHPPANATRAADTLLYAGVKTVSILNGGFPKWVAEGRPTTTAVPQVTPVAFTGTVNPRMIASRAEVLASIGTSVLVDARDTQVYTGEAADTWAPKPGHIPSAVSLPAPLLWNADGTYKSLAEINALVAAAVGVDRLQPIIVYCSVGGYASSWLWVLSQALGYRNVKMYDGSAQDWVRYYDMEM